MGLCTEAGLVPGHGERWLRGAGLRAGGRPRAGPPTRHHSAGGAKQEGVPREQLASCGRQGAWASAGRTERLKEKVMPESVAAPVKAMGAREAARPWTGTQQPGRSELAVRSPPDGSPCNDTCTCGAVAGVGGSTGGRRGSGGYISRARGRAPRWAAT